MVRLEGFTIKYDFCGVFSSSQELFVNFEFFSMFCFIKRVIFKDNSDFLERVEASDCIEKLFIWEWCR